MNYLRPTIIALLVLGALALSGTELLDHAPDAALADPGTENRFDAMFIDMDPFNPGETACDDALDDDGDTFVNDGCPVVGLFGESPFLGACANDVDDDGPGGMGIDPGETTPVVNDGCPAVGNSATSVATREDCARINENNTLDADEESEDTVTIDVTAEGIPPFHDPGTPGDPLDDAGGMLSFTFRLNYDQWNLTVEAHDPAIPGIGKIIENAGSVPADGSQTLPDLIEDSGKSTGGNTATTLNDTGKTWGIYWPFVGPVGNDIRITGGTGTGQQREITASTTTQVTVSPDWDVIPDDTSTYEISNNWWAATVTDTGTPLSAIAEDGDGVLDRIEISSDAGAQPGVYNLTLTIAAVIDVSNSALLADNAVLWPGRSPMMVPPAMLAVDTDCPPDSDADGILDQNDNCPAVSNNSQTDTDADGIGDICDACPNDPDNDGDGDGVCGDVDVCPLSPGPVDNAGCVPGPPVVGGIVELLSAPPDSPQREAGGSGPSFPYAALAGGLAAAAAAIAAGGWYVRRRSLR